MVRIFTSFTKAERSKMAIIHDIYKLCVEAGVPKELRIEKKKPVHKADVRDFFADTWNAQMGNGILKSYCESMITIICTSPPVYCPLFNWPFCAATHVGYLVCRAP
jgi:hypothetical protein